MRTGLHVQGSMRKQLQLDARRTLLASILGTFLSSGASASKTSRWSRPKQVPVKVCQSSRDFSPAVHTTCTKHAGSQPYTAWECALSTPWAWVAASLTEPSSTSSILSVSKLESVCCRAA